ncbi:MAG: carbohydrate kinase family protein [Promethearchaeota archaeon]
MITLKNSNIFCIGSLNWDYYYVKEQNFKLPGGSACNTAFFLNQLIKKNRTKLIGVVGNDDAGSEMLEYINEHICSTELVSRFPGITGNTQIILNEKGERQIIRGKSVTNQLLKYISSPKFKELLQGWKIHCKSSWICFKNLIERSSEIFSCDFSGWFSLLSNTYNENFKKEFHHIFSISSNTIHILLGNEGEFAQLLEKLQIVKEQSNFLSVSITEKIVFINKLKKLCRSEYIFVKRGSNGALVISGEGNYCSEALNVNVIDSTGAGDAFNAGILYGILTQQPSRDILAVGCILGSLNCRAYGGQSFSPNIQEIHLLKQKLHIKKI